MVVITHSLISCHSVDECLVVERCDHNGDVILCRKNLFVHLQPRQRNIKVKINGKGHAFGERNNTLSITSDLVFKAEQITCNFYTKAKTLQIQGKEKAEQLKLNLIALANEKLTVEVPSVNEKQYGGEFEDPHLTVPLQTTTYHQSHQSQSLQSMTCLIIHQLNARMPVILMLKKLLSKTI